MPNSAWVQPILDKCGQTAFLNDASKQGLGRAGNKVGNSFLNV